jgi:quinol monooxygenase YgiN
MLRCSASSSIGWVDTVVRLFLMLLLPLATISMSVSTQGGALTFAMSARVSVKDVCRSQFLRVMRHNAAETLAQEPGVVKFVLGEDDETGNAFFFHTQYKSQADFEYHKTTPHFAEYKMFAASDPYTEPPTVQFFEFRQWQDSVNKSSPQPSRPILCRNVELNIELHYRDEFLAFMDDIQRKFPQDSSSLVFDYGESVQSPSTFHVHEQYDMGRLVEKEAGIVNFDEEHASKHFYTRSPVVNRFRTILN